MPNVSEQLLKARSAAASAKIFTAMSSHSTSREMSKPCKQFSRRGACNFGDRCKFLHAPVPLREEQKKSNITHASVTPHNITAKNGGETRKCAYCGKPGHSEVECRKKQRESALVQSVVLALSNGETATKNPYNAHPPDEEASDDDANAFTLVFALQNCVAANPNGLGWVIDSGATSSATYNAADCTDIRQCNITVTAAGTSFQVKQIGTAKLSVIDTSDKVNDITIANCLISSQFPYRLLALQAFTNKGYEASMKGDAIDIFKPNSGAALRAVKDQNTKLFFLDDLSPLQVVPHRAHKDVLLARSYHGPSEPSMLWKLHLRHGHRNFSDICRQYKLPVPPSFPTCTSCVMGKSTEQLPVLQVSKGQRVKAKASTQTSKGLSLLPPPLVMCICSLLLTTSREGYLLGY